MRDAGSAMTNEPSHDQKAEAEADAQHNALVGLHVLAGRLPSGVDVPGFRPPNTPAALRTLADAPADVVTLSSRLAVLHDLAAADFPAREGNEAEYRRLAASVADPYHIDPADLLADLKTAAERIQPFSATASGQALPHALVAFIGRDVCTTRTVRVGGLTATWIFSEFETDAPFDQVADWVDPRNWPTRGPMLFKRMDVVGGRPTVIGTLGDNHWHGVFHEEVQLVKRLHTLLHCDYWESAGRSAGMTYELDVSLDGEINVDRGFLLVNDLAGVRRVKALKIVGFTADEWNPVAQLVCPFWTDWVRSAVEGGTATSPKVPTHTPTGAPQGSDILDAWVDFLGSSARTYGDLFGDMASRAVSGNYAVSDWVADGTRYWSQLAKDWARAWSYGWSVLQEVAERGLDATLMPPEAPPEPGRGFATAMATGAAAGPAAGLEGTTVPVPGLSADDRISCTPLVSIEAGGATIPDSSLTVTVVQLDDGNYGARLATNEATAVPGLYVGELRVDPERRPSVPVQLYISRATAVGGR
jgi:hypothetical protein